MKLKSTFKALAKALSPIPNRALRSFIAAALILHFTLYTLHSLAAEPLCWERTPNRPAPAQFDVFHGESLDFRCTFTGFGALPFAGASDVRLWYQTNGMGAAWWSIPATVSSNALAATFTPDRDPGAERLAVFFGAPSNAYAAAQVRFRNSPGAHPNHLEPPSVLDWQAELSSATNALAVSLSSQMSQSATNYTDSATNELNTSISYKLHDVAKAATNYADSATEKLHMEYSDGTIRVRYATALSDRGTEEIRTADEIFAQLDVASRITTNDVCNIVTNEVQVWSEWEWGVGTGGSFCLGNENQPTYAGNGQWVMEGVAEINGTASGGEDAASITFYYEFFNPDDTSESGNITATRTRTKVNALGFAKRSDVTNIVNKAYVESLGIESGVSEATVTNVVRSVAYAVNDYVWDGDVCWRRQMLQGGYLEYVAVTNIDVTLPENYKALEALERARRNQE